ncbi:hypothetical protein [Neotamlana laminarinivorans]|uniref:Uncharacterized protein n=1 Tax=Neotamlana laminarinivorans TaxID=2883124 RepID=A0A9X1I373_9FLAO|nr:hypothetical protein [Tamlana laminarinivorans]MCB4800210.1 hypothetical protein [Tamlana laminarinivorans]
MAAIHIVGNSPEMFGLNEPFFDLLKNQQTINQNELNIEVDNLSKSIENIKRLCPKRDLDIGISVKWDASK